MPAQLLSLSDEPSILLDKPIVLIGRHPECDIRIDSRKISRRHCCIAQVDDYLVVRDLASTNGIRINGVRVLEGRLKAGDELLIGGHRYRVTWEATESPRSAQRSHKELCPERPVQADAAEEDELLEACEEPVPLAEPGVAPEVAPPPKAALPSAGVAQTSTPVHERVPASGIIPDQLELAPSSHSDPTTPHPTQ